MKQQLVQYMHQIKINVANVIFLLPAVKFFFVQEVFHRKYIYIYISYHIMENLILIYFHVMFGTLGLWRRLRFKINHNGQS